MIGLDTNVLIRYIVQDDPNGQSASATRLIEARCTPQSPGFLSNIVLAEIVGVLREAYGYDRLVIQRVLRQIFSTAEFALENPAVAWAALSEYSKGSADFADYLIAHANHARGCTKTYTFDKKAAACRFGELVK